jgi:hypothetical protein
MSLGRLRLFSGSADDYAGLKSFRNRLPFST